jgi:hypothetical protein
MDGRSPAAHSAGDTAFVDMQIAIALTPVDPYAGVTTCLAQNRNLEL